MRALCWRQIQLCRAGYGGSGAGLRRPSSIRRYARRPPPPPPIKHASCWWPAKLGNTSTAFLCPGTCCFHHKQPAFRSEGIWRGRCAGPAWRWSRGRPVRRDVRWPSSIHPAAFPRNPDARLIRPVRRGDCSLPGAAQSDKFTPSVRESERPVDRSYAGAARVKIKANLSLALCYQFSVTCRPDVDVYNSPRHVYTSFCSSERRYLIAHRI